MLPLLGEIKMYELIFNIDIKKANIDMFGFNSRTAICWQFCNPCENCCHVRTTLFLPYCLFL